ncbi:MAG TPA: anti-sigma factor [Gemmatimonadales bacterium]
MTHPDVEAQIDAYLDGELAGSDAAELEGHLATCAGCERFRAGRLALRAAIAAQMPALEAPDALRARVRAALRKEAASQSPGRSFTRGAWRWMALAASLAAVAVGSWRLGSARTASTILTDEVLASHVRSLMPGHLSDVESSDQHTVKPWFDGKLDFSPPVHDFAGRGFPLLGGRLDYLNGRPVAALVYGRRKHVISVFLWPADRAERGAVPVTRNGYHVLHWATPEFAYWIASDVGLSELTEFGGMLRLADSTAARAQALRTGTRSPSLFSLR